MAAQNLQCPSCGAPVRWKGLAPVVECRYCKANITTGTGEVTQEPAVARSQVRPRNLVFTWAIIGFVMCTGLVPAVIGGLLGGTSGGGGLKTVPFQTVASLSMASTIGQLAEASDTEAWSETSLCVYFRGGVFDYVCFGWDEDHPGHVENFNFYCNETNDSAEAIKAWLDFYLGPRLHWTDNDGYSMYWAGSYVNASADLANMGFHVDPDRDPGWETRLDWYWAVALAAQMGQDIGVEEATRRQWLGKGYTFAQLAKLDVTDTVDDAQTSVPRRFPGAFSDDKGQSWTIPVDHPWIGEADLTWENSKGGKFEYVMFSPVADNQFTHQKTLRNCISKEFGKSEHNTTDHLAGKVQYSWDPKGLGRIDLYDHGLWVYVTDWSTKTPSRSEWKALMKRLDDCQP